MKLLTKNQINKANEKAIVIAIKKKNDKKTPQIQNNLEELILLLKTLKIETKKSFIHNYSRLNPALLIGKGKLEEIKEAIKEFNATTLVIDHSLTPLQVRNLEAETNCSILDRSLVIIDIFSSHAKTKAAKLQVEIARLEYLLPRLTGAWTHFQRQKGGTSMSRGMGETQIEIDRRRARQRISHLKKDLKVLNTSRSVQRKKRKEELKVALIGYTNSGKTTIMSSLSNLHTKGKDELFATLDSKIRVLDPSTHPKILISDTVGFIKNLPHDLIESFKSTLEEVKFADLLLHVIDLSHKDYETQLETTEKVLKEIKADKIPSLMVFNKIDQINNELLPKIIKKKFPESILVCGFEKENMKTLRTFILNYFKRQFVTETVLIPSHLENILAYIHSNCLIIASDYSRLNEIELKIRASKQVLSRLQKYTSEGPSSNGS